MQTELLSSLFLGFYFWYHTVTSIFIPLDSLTFLVVDDAAEVRLSFALQRTPSSMPDAGKKRSYDEEDEPSGKKTRGDGDSKDSAVHVYQPCVVLPELAGKMNSLVEVRLRALILGALHVSPPAF